EGAAVCRPGLDRRELRNRGFILQDRPAGHELRPHAPRGRQSARVAKWPAQRGRRVDFQLDEASNPIERMAEQEPRAVDRAEQVADRRKAAAPEPLEQNRRTLRLIHAALNLRGVEMRVDLRPDADKLPRLLEVLNRSAE